MKRRLAYLSLLLAAVCATVAGAVRGFDVEYLPGEFGGVALTTLFEQALVVVAVALAVSGAYVLMLHFFVDRTEDKRRKHDLRNLLRFVFVVIAIVGVMAALTQQYVGLLFSRGIVGFAVTFALQQPLFSLIGWLYIVRGPPLQGGLVSGLPLWPPVSVAGVNAPFVFSVPDLRAT